MGHCEQDEHAERSYRALFDTRGEWFCDDIRKADAGSMPDFELLCGGFPCQSFSIAGSRHGFADPRGTLFFELARVAEARKPPYLLFENVPGLPAEQVAANTDSEVKRIEEQSRHAPDPITWVDSTAEAAFIFTENGSYNAYARDLAGNVSEPYPFIVDHIDKHSPVIDSVEWDKGWSQEKTVTVKAHDTESGLGQYAVTRTADRPAEWQDSNVFANITENGTYYLWAKDNVQRVSADADADGGEDTPDPGPEEIVIDTIDRSRPVMDDILHSAEDNAPAGMFS